MLFIVKFTDHQHDLSLRKSHLDAHIQWLDKHTNAILVAGSLRKEPSSNPEGGLWIVDAPSKEAVLALIETDPFWRIGLRKKTEIYYWSKAFADRKVSI